MLSTTIDKYIYVIVTRRFDDQIRVGYTRTEIVSHPDALSHELIREALKHTGIVRGVEVVTIGDVPGEGTGLGTSGALLVGSLNAFYHYLDEPREPLTLAFESCHIELEVLGKPVGKQDQYVAALGGLRTIYFSPDEQVSSCRIKLRSEVSTDLGNHLMLFFTGMTRDSSVILGKQKTNTAKNVKLLRRMKAMVTELSREIELGNIDAVGEALHENWELKKGLADGITSANIDNMYQRAREAGALGGKITGAGGGGFFLLYVRPQNQAAVRAAMGGMAEVPIKLEPNGSKVLLDSRHP